MPKNMYFRGSPVCKYNKYISMGRSGADKRQLLTYCHL